MRNLTFFDYQKILKAVEILNSSVAPESLPKRMVNAVNCAVPGEITAFEMVRQNGEYLGCLIYEPFDSISSQELEAYNEHLSEHPFYEAILVNRRFDAIKIADFLPDTKFKETGIYNEYYRRINIDRQISVTMNIDEDYFIFCTMSRGGKDYDEDERAILNLMSPHLTAAIRNANAFEKIEKNRQSWKAVAESMGRTIIDVDQDGNIKYLSEKAKALLKKYFRDRVLTIGGLPDSLARWITENRSDFIRSKEVGMPPKPLVLFGENEKLIIRFNYDYSTNLISLLLFEEREISTEDLASLGLTNRETEILFFIAKGKTNPEIAILCDISVRTVEKHVENIFIKLGIETRTAAILKAKEAVR